MYEIIGGWADRIIILFWNILASQIGLAGGPCLACGPYFGAPALNY